jgi:isopenicillin N synthase-like dioxygenase
MSAASVEASLTAERQKRQHAGPLPNIPAISLKPFREGTEEGKKRVAAEWDRACREVGFIKIVDHGVPKEVIDMCWSATEAFFERPLEEKSAVPMTANYPYGYSAMGGENLLASLDKAAETPGDLKEMWNVCFGSDTPAADHPPPRWPAESEREQLAYRAYDRALAGLADTLYRVCALALGLEEDWFVPKIALFLIASLISSDCLPHQVRTQDCSLLNCLPHQL